MSLLQKQQGFFCDDDSIKKPLLPNTVPTEYAVAYAILGPPIIIIVTELMISSKDLKLPLLLSTAKSIVVSLLGTLGCYLLTELTKHTIGGLRPHFLTVCAPNWDLINCTDHGFPRYVTPEETKCTGLPDQIEEACKSFWSGHTQAFFMASVLCVLYLQSRPRGVQPPPSQQPSLLHAYLLLRPITQYVLLGLAVYVGLTRVADNWHHPRDVLMGAVVGTVAAVVTSWHILPNKSLQENKKMWDYANMA